MEKVLDSLICSTMLPSGERAFINPCSGNVLTGRNYKHNG